MVSHPAGDVLDVADLDFVGGRLCLDFANTTSQREMERPRERLRRYEDLVRWCVRAGVFGEEEENRLLAEGARRPAEAQAILGRALDLREAIFAIASAIAGGEAPPAADLDRLNAVLSEGMARRRLGPAGGGLGWTWEGAGEELDWMLWPLAHSAAELFSSGDVERVRECGGDSCDWLFVDSSRNGSRRWCVMSDCGNRAKARRHYHRTKDAAGDLTGPDGEDETRVPGCS